METNQILIAVVLFVAFLLARGSAQESPVLEFPEGSQAGNLGRSKDCEVPPEGGKTK